jgi:hypothetical protein
VGLSSCYGAYRHRHSPHSCLAAVHAAGMAVVQLPSLRSLRRATFDGHFGFIAFRRKSPRAHYAGHL